MTYDWTQDAALGLEKIAIPFMGNIMRGAGAVGKGVGGQLLKGVGTHALGGAAAGAALGGITAPEGETMSRMGRGALIGGAAGAGLGGFRGLSQLSAIGKAMPGAVSGAGQLAGGASQAAGSAARAAGKPIIDVTATSAGQAAAGLPGRAPVKGLLGPGPGGVSPGVSSQPLSRAPQGGATRYHPDLGGSVNTVPSSGQVTQLPGQKAGLGQRIKSFFGFGGQPPAAAAQVGAQMGGNAVGQAGQEGIAGLVSGGGAKWGHIMALHDLGLHPFNG